MASKFKTEELSPEENECILKLWPNGSQDLVRATPANGVTYTCPRRLDLEKIKNMPIYEDDLFIVTPPKCGTTWTQEIVWYMLNNARAEGSELNQFYRIPFLELGTFLPPRDDPYPHGLERTNENLPLYMSHSFEYATTQPRPRKIKSHLPLSFLPDNLLDTAKVIFVARNVKDMVVSYYYHYKLNNPNMDWNLFAKMYKAGAVKQSQMIPMVLEAWNRRSNPNLLFLTYENMKKDYEKEAKRIKEFLNVTLTPEQDRFVKERTSFGEMRKSDAVNKKHEIPHTPSDKGPSFIRKGIIGDWKTHFDQETNKEWDAWIEEEMKGTDFKMVFE